MNVSAMNEPVMNETLPKRRMPGRWLAMALAMGMIAATFGPFAAQPASAEATGASAPASSTPASAVRITVTRVRATSPTPPSGTGSGSGSALDVDPLLEKLQIARLRLGYAKYAQDQLIEKTVAWGETLSIPVDTTRGDAAGRYEIVPVRPGQQPGRLVLRVKEVAPSGKEPCLELETEIQASRLNLWFCDATIDGGTMLFFVRAEAVDR